MKQLNKSLVGKLQRPPERIIQFGEGNFLRGFIDWMIHQMNQQHLFNGSVVAIQPTPHGKVLPKLEAQDYLYTVNLRGIDHDAPIDQAEVITSISRGINPYDNWQQVLELAHNPKIQFVFSNTTEAGLTYQKEKYDGKASPMSFPGKLTAFLYERFKCKAGSANSGFSIFPCELLEGNGDLLREYVLKISHDFDYSDEFRQWISDYNFFYNTLVDRIVTGFPNGEIDDFTEKLQYEDQLLTVGEPFHLFVIDGPEKLEQQLPFRQAGLNVEWADILPFRELKVRILNGLHTVMYALGVFNGQKTVLQAMEDTHLRPLLDFCLNEEILPTLCVDEKEKCSFANSVIERFLNPFNKHQLTDLGMSGITKYKVRCLPSLLAFYKEKKECPRVLTLGLAATLLYFKEDFVNEESKAFGKYNGFNYHIRENKDILEIFKNVWSCYDGSKKSLVGITETLLGDPLVWDQDLTVIHGLTEKVASYLYDLIENGIEEVLIDASSKAIS